MPMFPIFLCNIEKGIVAKNGMDSYKRDAEMSTGSEVNKVIDEKTSPGENEFAIEYDTKL